MNIRRLRRRPRRGLWGCCWTCRHPAPVLPDGGLAMHWPRGWRPVVCIDRRYRFAMVLG